MIAVILLQLLERKKDKRNTNWYLQALRISFRAAMDIAAHGINAYQIRRVPGFASIPIGGLILLWACQPRITWLEIVYVWFKTKKDKRYTKPALTLGHDLLLVIAAITYTGIAVHFANRHGYFQRTPSEPPVRLDALLLYAGAALSLFTTGIIIIYPILEILDGGESPGHTIILGMYFLAAGALYIAGWLFWAGFVKLSWDL